MYKYLLISFNVFSYRFGLDHLITVTCQDVCGIVGPGGFNGIEDNSIDAVFLDLPEPWSAISHAKKILKPGRHICSYSPCAEQVIINSFN